MDVTIPGWVFAAVPLGALLVGAAVKAIHFAMKADERYVKRSEFDPRGCPTREECKLRHDQVETELQRRADRSHELANDLQAIRGLFGKLDKRMAVIGAVMNAIAKSQGIDVPPENEQ